MSAATDLDGLRERLADDHEFYAAQCLNIPSTSGRVIPFVYKAPQAEFARKLEAQRAAGEPMRGLVLKARKIGFSTQGQGMLLQRASTRRNHVSLCVAHDQKTASELFGIAEVMHANLPADPELGVKPAVRNHRRGQELVFGETSVVARRSGNLGLNSNYAVQTAKEQEAGRGFTVHSLWLSEAAFYPEGRKKFVALLNAVPDDPDTLIVQESTGNGHNHFRETWVRALEGRSDYVPYFSPWLDEPGYVRRFQSLEDRGEFIASIGEGEWGEDEPELIEQYGATPEQLLWRRWCIDNKCEGDLRTFWQEYPVNWQQAFMASGQGVFNAVLLDKVLTRTTEVTDPETPTEQFPGPELGNLETADVRVRRLRYATVEVAGRAVWKPRQSDGMDRWAPRWRVWEHPLRPAELPDTDPRKWVQVDDRRVLAPEGRYVAVCDPMSGELTEDGDLAYHAIQVIDHRTRCQVAEYRSRIDPDLIALELHLAALHWNQAWVGIEITGGYGLSLKNKLARDFKYPFMYRRRPRDPAFEKQQDLVGWDTNAATVVELRDTMRELLRTMPVTIRSRLLALEMSTYRQDERGRMGPEAGKFADLLMSFAIAQQIAKELPVRRDRNAPGVNTARTKVVVSRKAGY